MVGFDDAAMMGLGAINAGAQIYGQQTQKRGQKRLLGIQRQGEERHHGEELAELQKQEDEANRQAGLQQMQNQENAGEQFQGSGGHDSQADYYRQQTETNRRLQTEAIQRKRNSLNADWMDQQRSYKIQKKMQKSQQLMSMISTALMQGGSGAGAAMGGSSMGG
jgi:hypothetical protein